MSVKLLIPVLLSLTVLPSCAHPVMQVLQARNLARETQAESCGSVAQGVSDDVGQYIVHDQRVAQLTLREDAVPGAELAGVR